MAIDLFSLRMNLQTTGLGVAAAELKGVEAQGVKTAASLNTVSTEIKGVEAASVPAAAGISKMGLALGAMAVAGVAALAAFGFIKSSIKDAAESENSYVGLRTAVTNAGLSFQQLKPQLDAIATGIQNTTVFSDEAAREGLGKLIVATGSLTTAQRLLNIAVDLAAFKHISLESAAEMVGRVYNGNMRVLKEFGITTKGSADAIDQLELKLKGAGTAAGATFTGATIRLANAWSEVKEAVGNFVLQSGLTEFLINSAREVNTLANLVEKLGNLLHPTQSRIANATTGQLGSELQMLRNQAAGLPAQVGNPSIGLPLYANPALARNLDTQHAIEKELARREAERAQSATALAAAHKSVSDSLDKQEKQLKAISPWTMLGRTPKPELDLMNTYGPMVFGTSDLAVRGGLLPGVQTAAQPGQGHGGGIDADDPAYMKGASFMERMRQGLSDGLARMRPFGDQLAGFFQNIFTTGKIGPSIAGFGKEILAGMGSIFAQMAAKAILAAPLFQAIGRAMQNPFTAGFALLAFGVALAALGHSMGGVATGSGGGGGPASFDKTTQITLVADGAGGFVAPTAKTGDTYNVIGHKTPTGARMIAESTQVAARLGHTVG